MLIFYLLMMFRQLAPNCGSINFDLVTSILMWEMWDVVESIALFTYVFGIFPISMMAAC